MRYIMKLWWLYISYDTFAISVFYNYVTIFSPLAHQLFPTRLKIMTKENESMMKSFRVVVFN